MKKFGLGDHKFDPSITLHLSNEGKRICRDLTYIHYGISYLYSLSEDDLYEGLNGMGEDGMNGRITNLTRKRCNNKINDDFDHLEAFFDELSE